MFWEKNKNLIILAFFWILASIIVLLILNLEINYRVETWAIVTLVFVTLYYAIQTHKLIEQEKVALNEEKKKRNADFEEKKLKEFYNPFKYLLFKLRTIVENEASPLIQTLKLHIKIAELGSGYGHMVTRELEDKAVELLNYLYEIKNINDEDEEQLEIWREKALEKIEVVMKQIRKEINVIRSIISETYELFSERLENILTRKEENES